MLTKEQKVVNSLVVMLYLLFAVVFFMLTQPRDRSGEDFERLN
jgi:preprotein translocase subunit YajC